MLSHSVASKILCPVYKDDYKDSKLLYVDLYREI